MSKYKTNKFLESEKTIVIDNEAEELTMKCTFNKRRRGGRRNERDSEENPILDKYKLDEEVEISFCDFDDVLVDPELSEGNYEIFLEMKTDALQGLPSDIEIVNYQAEVEIFNPNYTKFLVYWRYFLVVLSAITYYFYSRKLKRVGPRQVLIE